MLIGHDTDYFIHSELFVPRKLVVKDGLIVYKAPKFPLSYDIKPWDRSDITADNWSSNNRYFTALPLKQRTIINTIKKFINNKEEWRTLLVFHDMECKIGDKYAHGNHLHLILETTNTQISKHGLYRTLQAQMSQHGGTVTCQGVRKDILGFVQYLTGDNKEFLGANSDGLRELFKEAQMYTGQLNQWLLDEEEEPQQHHGSRFGYAVENQENIPPAPTTSNINIPNNLQNKTQAKDSMIMLINMIKQNKDCKDISSLLIKYGVDSDEGQALCHLALGSQGDKAFKMALAQIQAEQQKKTIGELIQELPDNIPNYMTPRHSQAMFNRWCRDQNINARKYTCMIQYILSEKERKRIGIYLQGTPNSGKTVMTNTMWKCMNDEVGRITKENFCFQDCAGKRIIVGEEVAITAANIDRYKDLMSGATVKCEIKMKQPADCNPTIVMLNSNVPYSYNLDGQKIAQLKCRLYAYENLRACRALTQMTGLMHPKLFYDHVSPPSQDEIEFLINNIADGWSEDPIGFGEEFTGDWSEIPSESMATNTPTETEIVEETVTVTVFSNDLTESEMDEMMKLEQTNKETAPDTTYSDDSTSDQDDTDKQTFRQKRKHTKCTEYDEYKSKHAKVETIKKKYNAADREDHIKELYTWCVDNDKQPEEIPDDMIKAFMWLDIDTLTKITDPELKLSHRREEIKRCVGLYRPVRTTLQHSDSVINYLCDLTRDNFTDRVDIDFSIRDFIEKISYYYFLNFIRHEPPMQLATPVGGNIEERTMHGSKMCWTITLGRDTEVHEEYRGHEDYDITEPHHGVWLPQYQDWVQFKKPTTVFDTFDNTERFHIYVDSRVQHQSRENISIIELIDWADEADPVRLIIPAIPWRGQRILKRLSIESQQSHRTTQYQPYCIPFIPEQEDSLEEYMVFKVMNYIQYFRYNYNLNCIENPYNGLTLECIDTIMHRLDRQVQPHLLDESTEYGVLKKQQLFFQHICCRGVFDTYHPR